MYRLTPVQQHIVDRMAMVADTEVAPHAGTVDRDGAFPAHSIEALGKHGLLGLTIPEGLGGLGQGARTAAAAVDELGRRCPSTAMVYLMHLCGVACYLGAVEKTEPYVRAAVRGDHLSTVAFSERGSRSHFWAPVSRAVSTNGVVQISADKSFVTAAGHADGYVVSTLAAGARQPMRAGCISFCAAIAACPCRASGTGWVCAGMPAPR